MIYRLLAVAACALSITAAATAGTVQTHLSNSGSIVAQERTIKMIDHQLRHEIRAHRNATWYWQHKAGLKRTPTRWADRHQHSINYLNYVARYWVRTHMKVRRVAESILRSRAQPAYSLHGASVPASFYSQALCVHHGEGAWNANTGNGFGGGLQFMVGTWNGAASHSGGRVPFVSSTGQIAKQKPSVQIYAAYIIVVLEHAGWGQWPNTARACGLL